MKSKRNIIWIIIILMIGIYLFPTIKNRVAFAGNKPALNEMAPEFSLKDLSGKNVRLSDYKGKVVLVNFWASWCPPCKMEIPSFQKVYAAYKDRGFTIVGISTDDVSQSFIKDMGMTYPVVMADDKAIRDYGNIYSIPTSFLVGRDGRIIKKVMGMYFESSLKSDLENALKGRK
ncbi:MAG: TlpA disulfide reductase family protein [Nitrospiraceae bacterium]|jgi:cytochrome c biogenesis protein CcmG/thiol:disulfide interchange protein DsbE|nr:TlpA family protein disulfide reductase [Nitrospirota bacterium]MDA8337889.1 TlpA disulfide reductase family protein [Nitrospiraceae bacterium]